MWAPSHHVVEPELYIHSILGPMPPCPKPRVILSQHLGNLRSIPFCHVGPYNCVFGPKLLCPGPLTIDDYLSQALVHLVFGPKQSKVPLSWSLGHLFLGLGILGSIIVMGPRPHCFDPQTTSCHGPQAQLVPKIKRIFLKVGLWA